MNLFMLKFLTVCSAIFFLVGCSNSKTEIQTYKVKKGEFLIDVVESGELKATKSVNISAPALAWHFGMLKITNIVEDGTEVEKGDTVVLFDPSEIFKAKIDAKAELEIARAELTKLVAEQTSKLEELKSNLKISELNYKIAEIKLEQATFESEVTRKEIQLNLNRAKINLKKAEEEIKNQKKSMQKKEPRRD